MNEERYFGPLLDGPPWLQPYLQSQEWWSELYRATGLSQRADFDDTTNQLSVLRSIHDFIVDKKIEWLSIDYSAPINKEVTVNLEITPEITMFILKLGRHS